MRKKFIPEMPYDDGIPLLPDITPVIVVQGSNKEMGRQYAHQLFDVYGPWVFEAYKRPFNAAERNAVEAFKANVRQYAPEWIEMTDGMVAGAADRGCSVTFDEVFAAHCTVMGDHSPIYLPVYGEDAEVAEPAPEVGAASDCSGVAAWGSSTVDGGLVTASTVDHQSTPYYTFIAIPDDGNAYLIPLCEPDAPNPHPGFNAKGLAYVHHAAAILGEEKPDYGITGFFAVQHVLRYADNSAQALELELAMPKGCRVCGLWADTSGDAFNLTCREPEFVRKPGDYGEEDFLYVANTNLEKDIRPYLHGMGLGHSYGWPITYFEHGGWNQDDGNSIRRGIFMWNMMHNYRGKIDVEFMKMLIRFTWDGPDNPDMEEAARELNETKGGGGWDSRVGNMGNMYSAVMDLKEDKPGVFHLCTSAPSPLSEALTQHYWFFFRDPSYTFYELSLLATPAEIAQAAKHRASYDMYYANRAMLPLTSGTPPTPRSSSDLPKR